MKKKLTVNTLAFGNLKRRKKQYATLIIGIIAAMIFSSVTVFFLSCAKSSNEEFGRRLQGTFDSYYFAPEDFVNVKSDCIESYGYAYISGFGYTEKKGVEKGTAIARLDGSAKELYYPVIEEGRYPENAGEIAIERDALLRLGISREVGQEISLEVLGVNGTDYLKTSEKRTYTLVGILSDKRKNIEKCTFETEDYIDTILPAAFVSDKEEVPLGEKEIPAVYLKSEEGCREESAGVYENGEEASYTVFYRDFEEPIYSGAEKLYGKDYTNTHFIPYVYNSRLFFQSEEILNSSVVTVTLAVVLMLASCIGIINAFSTNLKERKRQIGLLRAVGATRRQIINIYGREVFVISLICAPVSILISYFAVKLFAALSDDSFIFLPDFSVLLITVGVSIVTVAAAALIPLAKASKTPPMGAIRDTALNRKMKYGKIKTQKSFTVPKLIAERSLKLHKLQKAAVTFILVVTVFISSFGFAFIKAGFFEEYFTEYLNPDYTVVQGVTPDTSQYVNMPNIKDGISEAEVNEILDNTDFSEVFGCKRLNAYMEISEFDDYSLLSQLTAYPECLEEREYTKEEAISGEKSVYELLFSGEKEEYKRLKRNMEKSGELLGFEVIGYSESFLESFSDDLEIIDGKIDINKLNSGEEIILVSYEGLNYYVNFGETGTVDCSYLLDVDDEEIPKDATFLKTAKSSFSAGDTVKLSVPYSDLTKINYDDYSEVAVSRVYEKEVKIGAIVKPFFYTQGAFGPYGNFGFITTTEGLGTVTSENRDYNWLGISYDGELSETKDESATEYLNEIFSGSYYRVNSEFATTADSENSGKIYLVSLLSVVILLFVMCASIVNNALSGKIREGKREIGTLRAVGASVRELTGVYIRQLVSMLSLGTGIGIFGYTLVYIAFWLYYKAEITVPFLIIPSVVMCVLLFLICGFNLYFKIKSEMKHSIVENIREL